MGYSRVWVMRVNFTAIHDKCLLTSSYAGLPTLGKVLHATRLRSNSASGNIPETETLRVAFTLHNFPPQELAPHFEGYFGEHVSRYPNGTAQLSSDLQDANGAHTIPGGRSHKTLTNCELAGLEQAGPPVKTPWDLTTSWICCTWNWHSNIPGGIIHLQALAQQSHGSLRTALHRAAIEYRIGRG
ncbi:hypothetical protein C8R44DRAFT_731510 [Mycena epipterygia]|nr:hypothetical protein C8R44DRAFT_731510 [Mycena epipterygia]